MYFTVASSQAEPVFFTCGLRQQRCRVSSTIRFCEKFALELCRKRKKMVLKNTPSSCLRSSMKFSTKNQKMASESLVVQHICFTSRRSVSTSSTNLR